MYYAYAGVFLLSLLLFPLYFKLVREKPSQPWLLLLFVCVSIVNLGYFGISVSKTVEFALLANKVVYLGQVIVPLCMFMIISELCGYTYKKYIVASLGVAAALMFGIVCTAGYLDWYYTDAALEQVAGASYLVKQYGVLHPTNLIYVVVYFVAMFTVIGISLRNHKAASQKHAAFMLIIVLCNIAMWIVQKIIPWRFELLSITYLMSAGAFLAVWFMLQDYVHKREVPKFTRSEQTRLAVSITTMPMEAKIAKVLDFVKEGEPLAVREREILEMILGNKKRRDIAAELHLSENTVKTYTRTLYSKLGVTCREELYSLLLQN